MTRQNPEAEVTKHVDQLRQVYAADNLEVETTQGKEALSSAIQKVVNKDVDPATYYPFGMVFLPPHHTNDGKSHIVVDLAQFTKGVLKDELTHEFSNYESWRRWGPALQQYQENTNQSLNAVLDEYQKRAFRKAGLLDKVKMISRTQNPAEAVLTVFKLTIPAIWDTASSVPADFVTVDKGFDHRLMGRKGAKLQAWTQETKQLPQKSGLFVVTNYPILAYQCFHPRSSQKEIFLDTHMQQYLSAVQATNLAGEIRTIRTYLHDITIPIDSRQMLSVLGKVAVSYLERRTIRAPEPQIPYWTLMRDIASEQFTQ